MAYKKLYRVKLDAAALELHKAYIGTSIINGYLAHDGKIQKYRLGDAKKKAYNWDGKIELYKSGVLDVLHKVSMTQIPANALLFGVEQALEGREMFTDADSDNTEAIYSGDVFEAILNEDIELKKRNKKKGLDAKTLFQLEELAEFIDTEYVQITNS